MLLFSFPPPALETNSPALPKEITVSNSCIFIYMMGNVETTPRGIDTPPSLTKIAPNKGRVSAKTSVWAWSMKTVQLFPTVRNYRTSLFVLAAHLAVCLLLLSAPLPRDAQALSGVTGPAPDHSAPTLSAATR